MRLLSVMFAEKNRKYLVPSLLKRLNELFFFLGLFNLKLIFFPSVNEILLMHETELKICVKCVKVVPHFNSCFDAKAHFDCVI